MSLLMASSIANKLISNFDKTLVTENEIKFKTPVPTKTMFDIYFPDVYSRV